MKSATSRICNRLQPTCSILWQLASHDVRLDAAPAWTVLFLRRYWMKRDPIDMFGITPRSTRRRPSRTLPVRSHFS